MYCVLPTKSSDALDSIVRPEPNVQMPSYSQTTNCWLHMHVHPPDLCTVTRYHYDKIVVEINLCMVQIFMDR